jgi:hypothetical protein
VFEAGDEIPGLGGFLGSAGADVLEVTEGGAGVEQRVGAAAVICEEQGDVEVFPVL